MDRDKVKQEENSKPTILTPLTTSALTATAGNLVTTTPDDDTSTESSDTFETWTLLNDKDKNKTSTKLEDNENRIEILKTNVDNEEDNEEEQAKNVEGQQLQDTLNDDFSDGISIISESESVGRISPHPYLRDHLHDLNLKFALNDNMEDLIFNKLKEETESEQIPFIISQETTGQELRQRRRLSSSANAQGNQNQALQKASQTVATSIGLPPLVKRGLQGIFYVGVGLAILALIGKIVNPTWQPLANVVSSPAATGELEQKLNDMELQNNLMRAEIDLLNKQVKYLTTLNDPQQQQQQQQKQQGKYKDYKEGKTFKAWSGNGDTLKPIDITKEDLRKPYKCPDGSFVEIANMCMEKPQANKPTLVDQFGKVVEDLKEQSEAFKTFEKVAEELQGFQDNPFEQLQQILSEGEQTQQQPQMPQHEFIKNKPIYQPAQDYKQALPYPDKYQKSRPKGEQPSTTYKQYKYDKAQARENKKSFGSGLSNESKEFKKYHSQEKSRENSKERSEWNSKERKSRIKQHFDDSQENSGENSRGNNSKERRQKRKFNKMDHEEDSGEWQEKYMKHRENQRKQNEQKYQDNKNWYIKRGDGREYKRSGEKQFR